MTNKPLQGHPYHRLTSASLKFIIQDASEAHRANGTVDSKAADKYLDQINDAASILAARERGELAEPGAASKGNKLKTRGGRDVDIIYVAPYGREFDNGDAIVGLLHDQYDGTTELTSWQRDGRFRSTMSYSRLDLVLPAVEPHLLAAS